MADIKPNLLIEFVAHEPAEYLAAVRQAAANGARTFCLRPCNEAALQVAQLAEESGLGVDFFASPSVEAKIPTSPRIPALPDGLIPDATLVCLKDPILLSELLLDYLDLEHGTLIAPKTDRYFGQRPLFLISIPKSGTHLLYELAQAFGYTAGIECPEIPLPGHWYCVEYTNSHTVARDFFIDTVRRSPFGNRHHPFPQTPAVFIYRNPLDIVVSEANYYHQDGATVFSSYLSGRSFEERLLRLIDDPWLMGSIRDRVGAFLPWLEFQNVIPISFEELVGASGGGDSNLQRRLIWSLQLKLHVPGNPTDLGNKVFNPGSATFHAGQIGAFRKRFTPHAYRKFFALPQDFMAGFGYIEPGRPVSTGAKWLTKALRRILSPDDPAGNILNYPARIDEFHRRPLRLSTNDFDGLPINILPNFLGHNIVRYKRQFFAVPQAIGPIDIGQVISRDNKALLAGADIASLQQALILASPDEIALRERRLSNECMATDDAPRLVKSLDEHNIVKFRNRYYVIPLSLGSVQLEVDDIAGKPGISIAGSLEEAVRVVER